LIFHKRTDVEQLLVQKAGVTASTLPA